MKHLTPQGQQQINQLAQRYGVSADAVMTLLNAVRQGNGTMAQFNHPELGGAGQWMQGGMTMVGDMFNNALKAKVDGLCSELSAWLAREPDAGRAGPAQSQRQSSGGVMESQGGESGAWWPAQLGTPAAVGAQNNIRYAYFPDARRLVVDVNGQVTTYDTLDHRISGVSQQQGGTTSLTFSSQRGTVALADLPVVSGPGGGGRGHKGRHRR
ncbi:MAG: SHOCT domain-containing protein [Pseudomonadota bacterium]|nr:SHOCT domain-containing protein [Pseudomonadota bacterium]